MKASPLPWFLIFSIPISCGYESEDRHQNNGPGGRVELTGLYPGPYFDLERNHHNVSAHIGTHAYLPCFVKQLSNKSVAWIRTTDSHIITVDRYTFIADERFQVIAAPPGDSWILQIKYVQPRDAGIFECQVSTEPKMAMQVTLVVLVPSIRIDTAEENMFVWEKSQIQLRCIVQDTLPDNLGKILWFRNGQLLSRHDPKNSVVFQSRMDGETMIETATFPSVQKSQSGNYTCFLNDPTVLSASVTLHVLSGENPAAMHHGRGVTASSNCNSQISPSSIYLRLLLTSSVLIFLLTITSSNYNS